MADNEKDMDLFEDGAEESFETVTLVDVDTNEEFTFAIIDEFEYKDKTFYVLITMEDETEEEILIAQKIVEENGEITIATLEGDEEDEVYDYYDSLCDEIDDEDDEDDTRE